MKGDFVLEPQPLFPDSPTLAWARVAILTDNDLERWLEELYWWTLDAKLRRTVASQRGRGT